MPVPRSIAVAAAATAAALVAVGSAPAGAQSSPAPTSRASAEATALELRLFGQSLTVSDSVTIGASATPLASARGVAFLLADSAQGESVAETTADGQSAGSPDPVCSQLTLPPEVPLVDLATACSAASTTIAGGAPSASAGAELATLAVDPMEVVDLAAPLESELEAGLAQVFTGLAPLFEATDQSGVDVPTTLQALVDAITDGGDFVSVDLGPTGSAIAADAAGATASASADGAVVRVLDRAALGLDPVLTVEIGSATAEVVVDQATGQATPAVSPAFVRVTIAADIAALLPDGLPNPVEVAPGQTIDIPLPAPFTSRIVAADGTTTATDDGGQRAQASAVRLELLTGLPEGGVGLDLATATAEAAAAPVAPEAPTPAPPAATAPPALARTGGDGSLLLPAVLAGCSVLGLSALRRTRRSSW